ncbi:CoA-binding protein [bacterium]|nr:CoA-binding protein [bacterium]
MKRFFEPDTVALIGASAVQSNPGYDLFLNMRDCFGENFYPVNPRVEEIDGIRCYPTILDVPVDIDLAVVFIPARFIPVALEQCAQKNITRVVIQSGGFAESGPEGVAINERCLEIARQNGIRVWGPNCMGLINVTQMKVLSFMKQFLWKEKFVKGPISLVVQSGMLSAGFLATILGKTPFGLSKVASLGNKMDVDESDMMAYLIDDPETRVIALYLESIKDGRRFYELCRSTHKPIVILKSGRTRLGAAAATSHTASLAQNDAIIDGMLRQAGVIRVFDMNDLLNTARCLGISRIVPKPGHGRVAVLTFSGGAGVVTTDSLADYDVQLADFPITLKNELKTVFPDWMDPSNPLDLFPAVAQNGPDKVYHYCLEKVLDDPGVAGVFLHIFTWFALRSKIGFEKIAQLAESKNKPVIVWILGEGDANRKLSLHLESLGIPVVEEISDGIRVLSAMIRGR